MTEIAMEHELENFLEKTQEQNLITWNRERTKSELSEFVLSRLDMLDEVEI